MATKPPATYADIEALPDNVVGEIIDGELFVSPRPRPRHGLAAAVIAGDLMNPFHHGSGGPGGWWILPEPELHLGPHVMVPDLAGWRRARMPEFPEAVGIELAPDWVCEVLSPSTAKLDRTKKLRRYADHGVGHVWLVDPLLRTLEVLRHEPGGWLLVDTFAEDERVRAEPFDAIELDLSRWWPPVAPAGRASESVPQQLR